VAQAMQHPGGGTRPPEKRQKLCRAQPQSADALAVELLSELDRRAAGHVNSRTATPDGGCRPAQIDGRGCSLGFCQAFCLFEASISPGFCQANCTRLTCWSGLSVVESCMLVAEEMGWDVSALFSQATVFVSYSWLGTAGLDLVAAVSETLTRNAADMVEPFLWIDLLTVAQHSNTANNEQDIAPGTFNAAIGSCGITVLRWAPWRKPSVLGRVWCLHELGVTLQKSKRLLLGLRDAELAEMRQPTNLRDIVASVDTIRTIEARAGFAEDWCRIHAEIEARNHPDSKGAFVSHYSNGPPRTCSVAPSDWWGCLGIGGPRIRFHKFRPDRDGPGCGRGVCEYQPQGRQGHSRLDDRLRQCLRDVLSAEGIELPVCRAQRFEPQPQSAGVSVVDLAGVQQGASNWILCACADASLSIYRADASATRAELHVDCHSRPTGRARGGGGAGSMHIAVRDGEVISALGCETMVWQVSAFGSAASSSATEGEPFQGAVVTAMCGGRQVVAGLQDGTLVVRGVGGDLTVQTKNGQIDAVANLPNGWVASGHKSRKVLIWRCAGAINNCVEPMHILEGHTQRVNCLACLKAKGSDCQLVASGSDDSTVRLWDATRGTCIHVLQAHTNAVRRLGTVSNMLATCSARDGTVRLFKLSNLGSSASSARLLLGVDCCRVFEVDGKPSAVHLWLMGGTRHIEDCNVSVAVGTECGSLQRWDVCV
jgi:hypothetical protein